MLYCANVRSQLEYGGQITCPHLKKDIIMIERVQKKATKYLPGMKYLSYEERLRKLDLPTLAYRRLRGAMIEVFKIFNIYDKNLVPNLQLIESQTRGHDKKLFYPRTLKDHPKQHSCSLFLSYNHFGFFDHLPMTICKKFQSKPL